MSKYYGHSHLFKQVNRKQKKKGKKGAETEKIVEIKVNQVDFKLKKLYIYKCFSSLFVERYNHSSDQILEQTCCSRFYYFLSIQIQKQNSIQVPNGHVQFATIKANSTSIKCKGCDNRCCLKRYDTFPTFVAACGDLISPKTTSAH